MSLYNQHLLFEIIPPDIRQNTNYLFATIDSLPKSRQRQLTHQIASLEQFKNATALVTEFRDVSGDLTQYIDEKVSEFYLLLDEWVKETQQSSGIEKQITHQDNISPIEKKEKTNDGNSIAQGLKFMAKKNNLPIYPLDSLTYAAEELIETTIVSFMRPSHLVKLGLITATAPVTLLPYLAYTMLKEHKTKESIYKAYKKQDIEALLKALYRNKAIREHWINERTEKWLDVGYDGDDQNPTTGGLSQFLLSHDKAFIAVNAAHIYDWHTGLIRRLIDAGFKVKAIATDLENHLNATDESHQLNEDEHYTSEIATI
jgi:hypothetical protein